MTFEEFQGLLATSPKHPGLIARPHGAYGKSAATKSAVGIQYVPGGKVYDFRGSYTEILEKFDVAPCWYLYVGEIITDSRGKTGRVCQGRFWTQAEAKAEADAWMENYPAQVKSAQAWGTTLPAVPEPPSIKYYES